MPYRVLMIAPTSFFGDYGCHVRILEETLALQRLGHQVRIVTYPLGRNLPELDIVRTRSLPYHASYEVGSSRHKFALDALLAPRALRAALSFRPDIIHAHLHDGALIGGVVAALLRKPLVFDFQGSLTGEMVDHHFLDPRGSFYRPVLALEHFINRLPSVILTSSPNGTAVLTGQFGVPANRIVPLPDAVDPRRFAPRQMLDREHDRKRFARVRSFVLGIPPKRSVVVYLGLMADYQGVGLLVEAAAEILKRGRNVHFLLMGYPGAARYIRRAQELGIADRVSFPGRIPYEEAPHWLGLGDIAVAPKMSATEGNGKILNYMATGLPVVAFDNPVSREFLGDDGVYAPSGNMLALADGIDSLLGDAGRARDLGQRLRERAIEKFAWDHSAIKIEQVYASLLRQAPASLPTIEAASPTRSNLPNAD
ncbi:MAG: glycosyltransferase family 4 protein [Anaerolineae bacterium]